MYARLVIQHKAIPQTRKTLTDVSPSDFIILFLKQEGQDVSLLKPNNWQLYKRLRIEQKKAVNAAWNRKLVFSIIQRNWFMKSLKSQNRCIVKWYSFGTHTRLRNLVSGSVEVFSKISWWQRGAPPRTCFGSPRGKVWASDPPIPTNSRWERKHLKVLRPKTRFDTFNADFGRRCSSLG